MLSNLSLIFCDPCLSMLERQLGHKVKNEWSEVFVATGIAPCPRCQAKLEGLESDALASPEEMPMPREARRHNELEKQLQAQFQRAENE